jgi:predicted nucleic acid-binding protein
MYLLDTDVLIDYLRGKKEAASFLEQNLSQCSISVLTVAELYSGAKTSRHSLSIEALTSLLPTLPVDFVISKKAGEYRSRYGSSHGTGIVDAILAATAEKYGAQLVSRNRKHFPMIENLLTPY